jgi:hypothetical protein
LDVVQYIAIRYKHALALCAIFVSPAFDLQPTALRGLHLAESILSGMAALWLALMTRLSPPRAAFVFNPLRKDSFKTDLLAIDCA